MNKKSLLIGFVIGLILIVCFLLGAFVIPAFGAGPEGEYYLPIVVKSGPEGEHYLPIVVRSGPTARPTPTLAPTIRPFLIEPYPAPPTSMPIVIDPYPAPPTATPIVPTPTPNETGQEVWLTIYDREILLMPPVRIYGEEFIWGNKYFIVEYWGHFIYARPK